MELLYKQLRAGDAPSIDIAQKFIDKMFFSTKKYDLGAVGRYRINKKFGPGTLFYAAAGLKKDGDWQSRTHHLSPRYTTKWGELPHVY